MRFRPYGFINIAEIPTIDKVYFVRHRCGMPNAPMILGCDPGSTHTAIACFNGLSLRFAKKMPNAGLLAMLRHPEANLSGRNLVIEMIGHYGTGMPAGKDVFDTCLVIGAIREIAEQKGAKVTLVLRKTIAAHLCGSAKAGDAAIGQALRDRFGGKGTKAAPGIFHGVAGSDQWSAIAIATWGLDNLL